MNKDAEKVILLRSGIVITRKCTLKCKLCGGYMPYYENPQHIKFEVLSKVIDNYFSIVDKVGDFSITGGEPLLHPDLLKIVKKVLQYADKIDRILILTNGTLMLNREVVDLLAENKSKCHVTISNYGQLSKNAEQLEEVLKNSGISCRVIKYSGTNLFCDGWVDYGDHTQKFFTQEEIDEQGKRCAIRKRRVSIIENGQLHSCGRSFRRMDLGIIPKNKEEYIDLLDDSISNEEKRHIANIIFNKDSTTSCAYCNGLCEDSKRYPPAEQLK